MAQKGIMTAQEMNRRSLESRYRKYGGKIGFKKFMREIGSKGGKAGKNNDTSSVKSQ